MCIILNFFALIKIPWEHPPVPPNKLTTFFVDISIIPTYLKLIKIYLKMHQIAPFLLKFSQGTMSSTNKLVASFVDVAMNTDIFKLYIYTLKFD